jgi:predicted PolB exonuclease-like 3'-5' exonuclease
MNSPIFLDIETVPSQPASPAVLELAKDQCVVKFASLSPWLAQVVCIGVIASDGQETALVAQGEAQMLSEANDALRASRGFLVTFGGRFFDVPVLVNRMLVHGLEPCRFLVEAFFESKYKATRHIDLADLLTGFGAAKRPTLREVCLGHGLPDPKAAGNGSDVAALHAAGEFAVLASYCLGDVRSLAALWSRVSCLRRAG